MPIAVVCPSCKAKLKAPDALIGKTIKCPGCQAAVSIKAPAEAAAPVARSGAVAKAPVKKPAPVEDEDLDDITDEPPPRKPVKAKGKSKVEEEDLDDIDEDEDRPKKKAKSKSKSEDEVEDIEDLDDVDEDEDRPKKKGKGKALAPAGGPTTDQERSTAMMIYVAAIITGFIQMGTLGGWIWWLMKRKESKFIDHHGKQFANQQITGFIFVLLLGLCAGIGAAGFYIHWAVGVGLLVLVGLIFFGYVITMTIIFFMAMFKAKAGVWYRMPFILQLLK